MNKYIWTFLFSALVISFSTLFVTCKKEEPELLGSIKGIVTDEETNEPVQGAIINLIPGESSIGTGSDGKFSFSKLVPDDYIIQVEKDGYSINTKLIKVVAGEERNGDVSLAPIEPVLSTSVLNLDFGGSQTSLPFDIENTGEGNLEWEIVEDADWLDVNPKSGTTNGQKSSVTVVVDRSGLDQGTYTQSMAISSNGGSKTINVSMTVDGPVLSITPKDMDFGKDLTSLTSYITNTGIGTVSYTASSESNWISFTPTSGSVSNETDPLTITVNRDGLDYGNYEGTVVVNSSANTEMISVVMVIPDPNAPLLSLSTYNMNFGDNEVTKVITLSNTGNGDVSWTMTKNQNWMSMTANSGTLKPEETIDITVTVSRDNLNAGDYKGTLGINSNGGTYSVNVDMQVVNVPVLAYTPAILDLGLSGTVMSFDVSNTGSGNLDWNVTSNSDWITLNPKTGANFGTVNVSVDRSALTDGDYSGQVSIVSNAGTGSVIVKMRKQPANTSPTAVWDVTPASGDINTEFSADASGCYDDYTTTDELQVRWRWESSSAFSNWTTTKYATHTYSAKGDKTITLEVKDGEGAITSDTKTITVTETSKPPVACFEVLPVNGSTNTTFTLDVSCTKDYNVPAQDLEYRWDFENDGTWDMDFSSNTEMSYKYSKAGTYTIKMEARNTMGLTHSATQDILVGTYEGFENGIPLTGGWSTGGTFPWAVSDIANSGSYSAKSTDLISESDSTWLKRVVTGPALLIFQASDGSNIIDDHGYFYIDENLMTEVDSYANNFDKYIYQIPEGEHNLIWIAKGNKRSHIYLDDVELIPIE